MKKPYLEPKMTIERFEDSIVTRIPTSGGEGGGSLGIIFEDEEY